MNLKDLSFVKIVNRKFLLYLILIFLFGFFSLFTFFKIRSILVNKVETGILKQAIQYNLPIHSIKLQKINFSSCQFSQVKIGKDEEIVIPYLSLHYNFFDLINKKKIKKIFIEGLSLKASLSSKRKLSIKGLPQLKRFESNKNTNTVDFQLPDIMINNSFLIFNYKQSKNIIPFSMSLIQENGKTQLSVDINSNFGSAKINGILSNEFSGKVIGHVLITDLNNVLNNFQFSKNVIVKGKSSFVSEIVLTKGNITNFNINNFETHLKLFLLKENISFNSIIKGNFSLNKDLKLANLEFFGNMNSININNFILLNNLNFNIKSQKESLITFSVDNGHITKPFLSNFNMTGTLKNLFDNPQLSSNIQTIIKEQQFNFGNHQVTLKYPINIKGKTNFFVNSKLITSSFHFNQKINLDYDDFNINVGKFKQSILLKGNFDNLFLSTNLNCQKLKVDSKQIGFFESENLNMVTYNKLKNSHLIINNGSIKLTNFNYFNSNEGISVTNGQLSLPFNLNKNKNKSTLFISNITTPDIFFENFKSEVTIVDFKKLKINFNGITQLPVNSLFLNFKGIFTPLSDSLLALNFNITNTQLVDNTSLSSLSSELEGLVFNGNVSLSGTALVDSLFNIQSSSTLLFNDFSITDDEKTWKVENLSTKISFTDFFNFKSAPNQVLKFDYAGTGSIGVKNGIVTFNIINDETMLIEKTKMDFCDGTIFTSAFQLSPTLKKTEIDVYCQKLSLSLLLNTFLGENKSIGTGYLSGIIPVVFENDNIQFEKSFLHSVPGEQGTLKIEDSKDITGGVLLAEEAIKNFQYDWAKIDFETINNNLNLILRLDGKPATKLPLVYDDKTGDFIKTSNNEKHVELQGLKLDLKFVDIDINKLIKEQQKLNLNSN